VNNVIGHQNLLASQTVRVNNVRATLAAGFLADESALAASSTHRTIHIAGLAQSWLSDKDMDLKLFDKYAHWIPKVPLSIANIACLRRTTNMVLVVSLYQSLSRTPVVRIHLTTDSHRMKSTDPWTEEQLTMSMTFGQDVLRIPDSDSEHIPVMSGLFTEHDPNGTAYHTESQRLSDGLSYDRILGQRKTLDFDEYLVASTRPPASRRWTSMTFSIGHVVQQVTNPYDQSVPDNF
jgi:hypothetical protein